jgi:hypothetical protein
MFSPKLELARIWPCSVRSQTIVKGIMQAEGCVMKVELYDNSTFEIEVVYRDPSKFKFSYKILKSSKPCYEGCEVQCSIRMRPVTFCGCPFLQAIRDQEVCKKCTLAELPVKASQRTFFEWRTKFSKPIPMDQMEMVRCDKLTIISDMMKDMSGELALMNMRAKMADMDMFVSKKLCTDASMVGKMPSKCPMGSLYTYEQARMDAKRYESNEHKK